MTYIDKDKLKDDINRTLDELADALNVFLDEILNEVELAEDIEAVPVVRCGDCKYSETWYGRKMKCKRISGQLFDQAHFCAYGEVIDDMGVTEREGE